MSDGGSGAAPPVTLPNPPSFPAQADGEVAEAATANGLGHYSGPVRGHRMNGAGTLRTALGTYQGSFIDDELEGCGSYVAVPSVEAGAAVHSALATPLLAAVQRYTGGFHRTRFEGLGTLELRSGDSYEGPLVAGVPDGAGGTYRYADGRVYTGELRAGRRHGHGRLTETNGDVYEGEFVEDTVTGFGTATYAGGARVYTGLWDKGAKVQGRLAFPGSTRMYEGQWRDERPHGCGVMVFASGDRYEGDFAGGMLQGVGLLTYAAGPGRRHYHGQFLADHPHGRGRLVSCAPAGAETVVEGYFAQGQLVPPQDVHTMEHILSETRALPPFMERGCAAGGAESIGARLLLASPAPAEGGTGVSASASVCPAPAAGAWSAAAAAAAEASVAQRSPTSEEDVEEGGESPPDGQSMDGPVPGISSVPLAEHNCTGWLDKCSIGRSTLGLVSNWKRRFFILTSFESMVCLGYYEDELCRKPIGFLRLSPDHTRIVTRPSTRTHKKASRPTREFCIIYHERSRTYKLLLRAVDSGERDRWVAALLRYFTIVDRPSDHPLPDPA